MKTETCVCSFTFGYAYDYVVENSISFDYIHHAFISLVYPSTLLKYSLNFLLKNQSALLVVFIVAVAVACVCYLSVWMLGVCCCCCCYCFSLWTFHSLPSLRIVLILFVVLFKSSLCTSDNYYVMLYTEYTLLIVSL